MKLSCKVLILLCAAVLLPACQSVPEQAPGAVSAGHGKCMRIDEPYCHSDWWRLFEDPTLNDYMASVTVRNRDLAVAALTLQKSLLDRQKHRDALRPGLTVQAGASEQRRKDLAAGTTTASTQFDTALNASWELDLWGKLRLSRTLAEWEKNAVEADRQGVFLNLTGMAVREYFALIALNQKISDNEHSLKFQYGQQRFLQSQLQLGLIAPADLVPVAQSINGLKQNRINLDNQKNEIINTLATLSHTDAADLPGSLKNQKTLPKLPDIFSKLPADALARRPDIQAMLWRLSAALQQKNLIRKSQYPTLVFSAGASAQNARLLDLFTVPLLNWGVSLNLPPLNPRDYRRNIELARLDGEIAALNAQSTVHKALADVQHKLLVWRNHQNAHRLTQEASRLAKRQLDYQTQRHRLGMISAKELEEAKEAYRQSQNALTDSLANQAVSMVVLYQALGGVPAQAER